MIYQLIITFGFWLVLMWVGINLIGMLVRGLVLVTEMDKFFAEEDSILFKIVSKFYEPKRERTLNVLIVFLVIIYLGILFYFGNIWIVIAAGLIMVGRVPSLLWDLHNSKGVDVRGAKKRADLFDDIFRIAKKNGVDVNNEKTLSLIGKFVLIKTRQGKLTKNELKKMPIIYKSMSIIYFIAFLILWYGLYHL